MLFNFLKTRKKPVVWTLHDCWSFTGHCSFFDYVNCEKWKTHCAKCPLKTRYPASYVLDNSFNNFNKKKEIFNDVNNLTMVTPSNWLKELLRLSFLKNYPVSVIHNGVDLSIFKPIENKKLIDNIIILGVANIWDRRKGLIDFLQLRKILPEHYQIVLIGLSSEQIKSLPENIIGIERTSSIEELSEWYNKADVFLNPTYVDNFPTTNIEALACGTSVVTYNTGGSPEAIDINTGRVVEKGNINGLVEAIYSLQELDQTTLKNNCRRRAAQFFNKDDRYAEYIKVYEQVYSDFLL